MGFSFSKPTGGGKFFKPADHVNDLAILVETTRVRKDVPNEYEGKKTTRDEADCRLTIFGTQQSIDKAEPTEIIDNAVLVHTALTGEAERNIGQPLLVQVRKQKNYYVFKADYSPDIEKAVAAYYEKREAAVAEAMDAAPDFD